jgi:hypothetical protein
MMTRNSASTTSVEARSTPTSSITAKSPRTSVPIACGRRVIGGAHRQSGVHAEEGVDAAVG